LESKKLRTPNKWSLEETESVMSKFKKVTSLIPEVIKSINFPNGSQIIIGNEKDETRTAAWNLDDLDAYARRLAINSKLIGRVHR
jgi:hypothetical protein